MNKNVDKNKLGKPQDIEEKKNDKSSKDDTKIKRNFSYYIEVIIDNIDLVFTLFFLITYIILTFFQFFYSSITIVLLFIGSYTYISTNKGRMWLEKKCSQLKTYISLRTYLKFAKSLNHSTTLMVKYLLDMEVNEEETECDTYNEIKDKIGPTWPFMKVVKDTRAEFIDVENKKTKCISSYNYLNLGRDERVQEAAIAAAKAYSSGNHGPRMLCGNLEILEQLENKIASFYQKESALVFNSGFLACMSIICGVSRKGDLVLMDKLNHASLRYGCKASSAKTVYFKHNDYKDAEKKIIEAKFNPKQGRLIIVTEGIFSMDGNIGHLDRARKLADKYNGLVIIDEAHSLGITGKTGRGTEELFNYKYKADLICGTFSKSISSVGGFIACSKAMRDYLCFYSPGLVFSAPLSAYHCGAALKSFEIIEQEPFRVEKTQKMGEYMRKKLVENGFDIGKTETNVVPVIFPCVDKIMRVHRNLLERGYFSAVVMAPACPLDKSRFRLCATYDMTTEDIDNIVEELKIAQEKEKDNEKFKKVMELMV